MRAIKLTLDAIEAIVNRGMNFQFDVPPKIDELLDVSTMPDETYYLVTEHPGVTRSMPISWVLIPEFMFEKRFAFAGGEPKSSTDLGIIYEKAR